MRDEDEFTEKMQYMADSPVKSGLVDCIQKYDGWFINPGFLASVGIGSGDKAQTEMSVPPTKHGELREVAKDGITRHHYLGFAETQWKPFEKEIPPRVKPLLYVYRVLLTGIHLMQTGMV